MRRSSLLLAVETTLETLSDAGRHNFGRQELITRFERLTAGARWWYLYPEQQIGVGLYQSMIGKLTNLPDGPLGSAFPPDQFIAEETTVLRRERVFLSESLPNLLEGGALAAR